MIEACTSAELPDLAPIRVEEFFYILHRLDLIGGVLDGEKRSLEASDAVFGGDAPSYGHDAFARKMMGVLMNA